MFRYFSKLKWWLAMAAIVLTASLAEAQYPTTTFANRIWNINNTGKSYAFKNNGDSVRFEVRAGDVFRSSTYSDPSNAERNELGDPNTNPPSISQAWIADFTLNFEPGPDITSGWVCLFQLKGAPSSDRSPPFELAVRSNTLVAIARYGSGTSKEFWRDSQPVKKNFPYKIHIEAYFNQTSGYARVWVNGVKVATYSGPMGFPENPAIKVRFGIYRGAAPETLAANFSAMKLQLVSPGTTQPPTVGTQPTPAPSATPRPASPTPGPVGSGIALVNPGFEQGLTGWENRGNSVTTSQSRSGAYAAAIGTGDGGVRQNVMAKLVPGRSYRLSAHARVGIPTETPAWVGVSIQRQNMPSEKKSVRVTSTAFQKYSVDFVAPSDASAVMLYFWKDAGSSILTVDDVSLEDLSSIASPVVSGMWMNQSLPRQNGSFTLTFDAVPAAAQVDAVMGVSAGALSAYEGYSAMVRFNRSGRIDAGNGTLTGYSASSSIPYLAGAKYTFRMVVNVAAQTYSAFVRSDGASEKAILLNAPFRHKTSTIENYAKAQNLSSATATNLHISLP